MKYIIDRILKTKPRKTRQVRPKKRDWIGVFQSLYPMVIFFVISLLLMYSMNEMDRRHKIEAAWYQNDIEKLLKDNKELKAQLDAKPKEVEKVVEKRVEVPKVVEKVVKVENSAKIRELRHIIVEKNIEMDQLRQQCRLKN